MWHNYINATSTDEVIKVLGEKKERARIIAGGTDLILELERGVRKGLDTLVDVSRIPGLDQITIDEDDVIHLGALVTHNACVGSKLIRKKAYPLARAAWEVGAPQIRNRGTIAGNLITASPANDTISPLMALGASVTLISIHGERTVALKDFYTGVRRTVMQPDEMLIDISFPAMKKSQRGTHEAGVAPRTGDLAGQCHGHSRLQSRNAYRPVGFDHAWGGDPGHHPRCRSGKIPCEEKAQQEEHRPGCGTGNAGGASH